MFFGRFAILTHIVRIAVGGLFIFSGFIKANDPVGFSIKLEEYFEVFGQGFSCDMQVAAQTTGIPCEQEVVKRKADEQKRAELEAKKAADPNYVEPQLQHEETFFKKLNEYFAHHSLFLAILICGLEMALGLFLLLGIQVRWTLLLLLAMIIFFSFLTFYSACCNKVTSCGCFGDAIPLTPWESFWKDLILLILISILFVGEHHIRPLIKNGIVMAAVAGTGLFLSFAFPVYTYRHLPIIDFRPYKIGTNWYEAMQKKDPATSGCKRDSVIITYYYQQAGTGKMVHFRSTSMNDSFPDSTYNYYCRHDHYVWKGTCDATILDFGLADPETGENFNDSILRLKGVVFFLIMEDIDKADRAAMGKVNLFYKDAQQSNVVFYGLSNSGSEKNALFREETGAKYPMLQVDGTALKTIIRSNPGLVMLKDGVAVAMWHANDIPGFAEAMEAYGK
ncbi:MAG TPA: BT_3928 family protein [Bacteroidia bacterium]|nr:BT_3928 family protein [Bacteroidia bacterium]